MTRGAEHDLAESMARLAQGDRAAFTPVFAALWPRCRSFARRLLADERDAEDATQRALLTLFSRAADFDSSRSLVGWALTLTAWECRTLVKKRARGRETALHEHVLDEAASPEERAVRRELLASLDGAFGALSESDQQAILDALDHRAPAADAAYRKRKQRALERLRAAWRSLHA